MTLRVYFGRPIIAAAFAVAGLMSVAAAQTAPVIDDPIIARGDAVVTGFSGLTALKPKPNAKLEDYLIIDTQAAALQVFDLSQMFGPNDARLVDAPRLFTVPAGTIGQVFGVALDDGQPATGPAIYQDAIPNIYATATSVYGLQIVSTKQVGKEKVRERAKVGSPQASWMDGQFGIGGGPGSIWKIDGRTGAASLFATVALDGVANSGPALGAIAFDPASRELFVSDLQTGMIHAFDLTGREVARFDHGTKGLSAQGRAPVAYDPKSRVDITSPKFNAEDGATWGFAARERRVWGLAVHNGRLFYAAVDGPDIWSVGLTANGDFKNDARVEIEVESKSGDPVSAIAFGRDGTIYLSQRGEPVRSYNYRVMAEPDTAQTLRYRRERLADGTVVWQPVPEEYAIGHAAEHRSSNGGVALGYGYDKNGFIRYDACEATLWTTGEILRESAKPDPRLDAGGNAIVHGLQGNPISAVIPANAPPMQAYFLDYDGRFTDPSYRGHMGQVAIWSCGHGRGMATPAQPRGPHIRVAKKCTAAGFGDRMHCRVTLSNSGDAAPRDPVGFFDVAEILRGPPGAGRIEIVSATPNHPAWRCSALPADRLACDIDGVALQPGRHVSVDVIMDVSGAARMPDFRLRNCATLDDNSQTACDRAGADLIVRKTGDRVCEAGNFCTFDISVFNNGWRSFDGWMFLVDNMTIPGVPAANIAFISPQIPGCNPATLPFRCTMPMTIGPGAERSFQVTVEIPLNAVPPGTIVHGRNCFYASDPDLVPDRGNLAASFLPLSLQTLGQNGAGNGPGFACWNFQVQAPGFAPIPPRCDIPVATLRVTPTPATFTDANENIKVEIELANAGNNQFDGLDNWKVTAPELRNLTCPTQNQSVLPRRFARCHADYTTKATDVGRQSLSLAATATAMSACGQVAQVNAMGTVKSIVKPALTVAVKAAPATFTAANEKIAYTYTVKNVGTSPVTTFTLIDSKATGITCQPAMGGPLGIGASATCTGSYTSTAGDVGNSIDSTASISGNAVAGPVPPQPPVHASVLYNGKTTVPIPHRPLLSVSVKPKPAVFKAANEKITYTFKVRNNGKVPLTGFTLTDSKATGIVCKPAMGGRLAVRATAACTGSYTTTAADVGNQIDSTASVTGKTAAGAVPAPAPANAAVAFAGKPVAPVVNQPPNPNVPPVAGNSPNPSLPVVAAPQLPPALTVTMTASPTIFTGWNDAIAFNYTVTNTGALPLTGFAMSDSKANLISCGPGISGARGAPLAPGASIACTGAYRTTVADVGNNIINTASVTGTAANWTGPPPTSPPSGAMVAFLAQPLLSIEVEPSVQIFHGPGEVIFYRYTVKNAGNMPLRSFALSDPNVAGLTCAPTPIGGPLALNSTTTCTARYTTTGADVARKVTAWSVTLNGSAVPAVDKTTSVALSPCPLSNFSQLPNPRAAQSACELSHKVCGQLEPKLMTLVNGKWTWEGTAWYTGCRDPRNIALLGAATTASCDRTCDTFHVPKNCNFGNPGYGSPPAIDEFPLVNDLPKDAYGKPVKQFSMCPWRIDSNGMPPQAPENPPGADPNPDSACWKPGGSGACPSGFTNAGLECVRGGSWDAAQAVAGQVFSSISLVISAIPGVNSLVSGIKSVLGLSKSAAQVANEASAAKRIVALVESANIYRKAKDAWRQTELLRKAYKVGSLAYAGIHSVGAPGSAEEKKWLLAHLLASAGSLIPGPLGGISKVVNDFAHPTCK